MTLDKEGAIYGTTTTGGAQGNGVAYKLTPSGTAYTENVLHSFGAAGDGGRPNKLMMDTTGALYGTTENGETAYKLTPTGGGAYQETILHTFGGQGDGQTPQSALLIDAQGRLFGTTEFGGKLGAGTAFELTPNGSTYAESIIHNFGGTAPSQPAGALISDGGGGFFGFSFYGGSPEAGTAYHLLPSAKQYSAKIVHAFNSGKGGSLPYGTPTIDSNGALYGVNLDDAPVNNGIVFKLTP